MYKVLLATHIFGAIFVGIFIAFAIISLIKRDKQNYSFFAKSIGLGGGAQLITGALLPVFGPSTLFSFCSKIGIYMSIIFMIEYFLYRAMNRTQIVFPIKPALSFLGIGMICTVISGITIFVK